MEELKTHDNGITIVKLGPGQSVKATCIATLVRVFGLLPSMRLHRCMTLYVLALSSLCLSLRVWVPGCGQDAL